MSPGAESHLTKHQWPPVGTEERGPAGMEAVYCCCCGVGVYENSRSAHLLPRGLPDKDDIAETQEFVTNMRELLELPAW